MRRLMALAATLALLGLVGSVAVASNVDTCTINYDVQAINELNIVATSVTLTVSTATAGQQPDSAWAETTYDITTNCGPDGKKITGVIDQLMPNGLQLQAWAYAPVGALSRGLRTLTTTPADLVTGIDAVAQSGIDLKFLLNATVEAGVVSGSRTFTMTLADSL